MTNKLYESTNGKVHLVLAGYTCNPELGKIEHNMEGDRTQITCKNCLNRLN